MVQKPKGTKRVGKLTDISLIKGKEDGAVQMVSEMEIKLEAISSTEYKNGKVVKREGTARHDTFRIEGDVESLGSAIATQCIHHDGIIEIPMLLVSGMLEILMQEDEFKKKMGITEQGKKYLEDLITQLQGIAGDIAIDRYMQSQKKN